VIEKSLANCSYATPETPFKRRRRRRTNGIVQYLAEFLITTIFALNKFSSELLPHLEFHSA